MHQTVTDTCAGSRNSFHILPTHFHERAAAGLLPPREGAESRRGGSGDEGGLALLDPGAEAAEPMNESVGNF